MARYDLYTIGTGDRLFIDVQAALLDRFHTRAVIPLIEATSTPPVLKRLHPILDVDGKKYVLATHLISAVPVAELTPSNRSLAKHHDKVVSALDMLFQGF
jgi:toxin CcdB